MSWPSEYYVLRRHVRHQATMTSELNDTLDRMNEGSRDPWMVCACTLDASGQIVYVLHRYLFAENGDPVKKGRTPDATSDQRRRSGGHPRRQRRP